MNLKSEYESFKSTGKTSNEVILYLKEKYWDEEYGIKEMCKEQEISYTQLRTFLKRTIGIRTGKDVVTTRVKKFRKQKAEFENSNNIGFNSTEHIKRRSSDRRGIHGFYFNQSKNKYVYLRSTWEYIFAKWLDSTYQKWDVEMKYYFLEDGSKYLPDFFIYDDNEKLKRIVEIKGYWDVRSYKIKSLREQLNADCTLIKDISKYIPENSTYHKELAEWKLKRLKELPN